MPDETQETQQSQGQGSIGKVGDDSLATDSPLPQSAGHSEATGLSDAEPPDSETGEEADEEPSPFAAGAANGEAGVFAPRKPRTWAEAQLTEDDVEKLVCRFIHSRGACSGRNMSRALGLPFGLLETFLATLKEQMILGYRTTAAMGDYEYQLSDVGADRARRYMSESSYAEAAPVSLDDYRASVARQSVTEQRISIDDLQRAFKDLSIDDAMLSRLGPGINSGRGIFLYGSPGNGKTSIAERITACYGSHIWIPRAVTIDGEVVRVFDPMLHKPIEDESDSILGESIYDQRWVKIVRPTVVVGGELTMDQLEIRHNPDSNVSEAPLQMKSNGGVLVIDDFGRQHVPTVELLNRWIIPLEKRYDFLTLSSGKKVETPFDQLIVFSTNLEPRDLVDDAFLRRIPYKIEVTDPDEEQYRTIWTMVAPTLGFESSDESLNYLMKTHYADGQRPMRSCHPRDLMMQVKSYCTYHDKPIELTPETLDFAVENYFAVL